MRCPQLFRTYVSAAVLTGCYSGTIFAIDATAARQMIVGWWQVTAVMSLVLTPAIAARSWRCALWACAWSVPAYFVVYYGTFGLFLLNGRNDMPLVVWSTPGVSYVVPGMGSNWQVKSIGGFVVFWLATDLVQLGARRLYPVSTSVAKRKRTPVRVWPLFVAQLPVIVLYPLTWRAGVSGTFAYPRYTESEYYMSLVLFALIFPVKNVVFHVLYDRVELRNQWPNSGREGADADKLENPVNPVQ